jgi:hypothetical protein
MTAEMTERFLREAPHVEEEVVECVRAICTYLYDTYGRFPAHCHAIDSVGVWMQCHHTELEFYDRNFTSGYSPSQAGHDRLWHDGPR